MTPLDTLPGTVARVCGDAMELTADGPVGGVRLPAGSYDAYVQAGRWGQESQGRWVPLHAGTLVLHGTSGRTTQGATPFVALRRSDLPDGVVVLHVLPRGDWEIRLRSEPAMHGIGPLVVEWGYSGGGATAPPAVAVLGADDPESAAPGVHRWWARRFGAPARAAPVCYNTWLDQFDNLELPRLRAQLAAARSVGCEVFVIDAGWFGHGKGDWFDAVGDWDESGVLDVGAWADEVRAAGLGFGLWMEPEHVGPRARVRQAHPEWFAGGGARLDLTLPAARAWLREQMVRLIERYRLSWLKVDFNIPLGEGGADPGLTGYYDAWYGLLDELRGAYPQVWFEGCASGGMRLELESLRHVDGHFLSDTTNAYEVIRIGEGTLLRCPPGRLGRWCVVRPMGPVGPEYPMRAAEAPQRLATAVASGWQSGQGPEWVDATLAVLAALPGQLGFSGDLAGLSEDARQTLARAVAWYTAHRHWLTNAHAHLLTPVRGVDDRRGWSALQLTRHDGDEHLLVVYRLQDPVPERSWRLRDVRREAHYRWTAFSGASGELSGEVLTTRGLPVRLALPGQADAVHIVPAG
ncbi:MAG: glycoside hydrolase family 36 protein [Tepidisphaerales bacterium]